MEPLSAVAAAVATVLVALITTLYALIKDRADRADRRAERAAAPQVVQGMTIPPPVSDVWLDQLRVEQRQHDKCDWLLIKNGLDPPHD